MLAIVWLWNKGTRYFLGLAIYCCIFFLFNFFFDFFVAYLAEKKYYFVYTLLEYITFSYLLFQNMNSRSVARVVAIISIPLLVFQVFYLVYAQSKLLDSVPIGVYNLFVLGYIFYYFYRVLMSQVSVPLYKQYTFWIAIGILTYLSGTFFFNILINHMPKSQIRPYWFITYIFDIIKNLLFVVAVVIFTRSPQNDNNKPVSTNKTPYLDFN
ncbi:hypothetical protein JMG10_20040 [Nostoc ellipsosporum NOK]|nr:hypothetical protein [Nostoc ellipsosporum NOK]